MFSESHLLSPPEPRQAGAWSIDRRRSSVSFSARALGLSRVRGRFTDITRADVELHGELTRFDGAVAVSSLDTGNATRDRHLRSPDFLDAAEHPLVELRADGVPLSGPPSDVKATATIRGSTRELTLQTAVEPDGDVLRLRATGDLDRRDFGVVPRSRIRDRVLTGSRIGLELEVLLVPDGSAR